MKPDNESMTRTYTTILAFVVLIALMIIIRAGLFMTFGHRDWKVVAQRFESDSVVLQPRRGSILADDGRVMVSSTPEYEFVFKYREGNKDREAQVERDKTMRRYMNDYCRGLHELIPEQSAEEFRTLLEGALARGEKSVKDNKAAGFYTNLYTKGSKRLSYNRYKEVKAFLDTCNIEYKLYVNVGMFKRGERDEIIQALCDSMDVVTEGLHRIVPEFSAASFRDSISKSIGRKHPRVPLCSLTVSQRQFQQIEKLPVFVRGKKSCFTYRKSTANRGFAFDEIMVRKATYGNLAARTLGRWDIKGRSGQARDGIELAYDSLLGGTPGRAHRRKVMDEYAEYIDVNPVNGCDIVTTIDVNIQDIANKALMEQMAKENADYGTAIVMETKTGDIKAMVNWARENGQFVIRNNYALNQGIETGSIFKTASILCALNDNEITLMDSVDTYPYSRTFYGNSMSDDAGKTVPYKKIPEILKYSSNVGVMTVIDEHYVKKGKDLDFLRKLEHMGIVDDHEILPGATRSHLVTQGEIKGWKGQALWMSVGYGISVTPCNMVAFYNAIANGGKMMRPRLVKEIQRDGRTIKEFETKVAEQSIASEKAIHDITECLITVVNDEGGTGHRAKSDKFLVAGKTGTAKISANNTVIGRWLNFCSFFPADAPEYTCGVFVYRRAGVSGAGGGGSMSAPVVHEIAERVMAYKKTTEVKDINDTTAVLIPTVKTGNADAADVVLSELHIHDKELRGKDEEMDEDKVPNVVGMGAKDALFAMESRGIRVRLNGTGRVTSQNAPAGSTIRKGMVVDLQLKQ